MPTVREKSNGRLVVVFKNRGRFVTKQLTPRGEHVVRGLCPTPNGAQIGYEVVNDLSRSGDAYTKHSKREAQAIRPAPPVKEHLTENVLPPWLNNGHTFPCSNCGVATQPGAAFCARCGSSVRQKSRESQSVWTRVYIAIGIIIVLWFCFHTR